MKTILASIVVALVLLAAVGGSYALSLTAIDRAQHQWCQTLALLTLVPAPKPANPAANPSRERSYVIYTNLVDLERRFGCLRGHARTSAACR